MTTNEKKRMTPLKKSQKRRRKNNHPFTLLEICLCIAIVALISGFLGIKIKDSIEYHNCTSSVSNLVSEMRRMQGFALSYRGEFGVKIAESKEGHFCYTLFSDEPVDAVTNFKPQVLKGVSEILKDKKSLKEFRFTILPTGK